MGSPWIGLKNIPLGGLFESFPLGGLLRMGFIPSVYVYGYMYLLSTMCSLGFVFLFRFSFVTPLFCSIH